MSPKIVDLRPTLTRSKRAPERGAPAPAPASRGSKKSAPLRERRRRMRIIAVMGALLFIVLVLAGLRYVAHLPSLRLQEVAVRGSVLQDHVAVETHIRDMLHDDSFRFVPKDGIFTYSRDAVEASVLRAFPRLQSVHVGRASIFGTTLIVNVDERTPFGRWCAEATGDQCYMFDEGGYIFATATSTPRDPVVAYRFSGGIEGEAIGSTFLDSRLLSVLDLLQRLREARYQALSFHIESSEDFTIHLQNGFSIKASFVQGLDTIVHNLELIFASAAIRDRADELEYIDLRFGNRVYYKFKGQAEPVESAES